MFLRFLIILTQNKLFRQEISFVSKWEGLLAAFLYVNPQLVFIKFRSLCFWIMTPVFCLINLTTSSTQKGLVVFSIYSLTCFWMIDDCITLLDRLLSCNLEEGGLQSNSLLIFFRVDKLRLYFSFIHSFIHYLLLHMKSFCIRSTFLEKTCAHLFVLSLMFLKDLDILIILH